MRGEVLIERQIEQLKAAGIDDITLVVGYKKEYFFYLRNKYGVEIVNNDEYASRNNNGSLWRVRNKLGNTYVCSSDDYFTENPFEAYVWKAYYSAQYAEGPTKDGASPPGANNQHHQGNGWRVQLLVHAGPRLLRPIFLKALLPDSR